MCPAVTILRSFNVQIWGRGVGLENGRKEAEFFDRIDTTSQNPFQLYDKNM
jgi:hypothetical protein